MASTKIILDTRVGVAPFPVKIRITHNRKSAYINTGFKLLPEQWEDKAINHPRAAMINKQLLMQCADIDCKIHQWAHDGLLAGKEAKDIKAMIERLNEGGKTPVTFGEYYKLFAERKNKSTLRSYLASYKVLKQYCDIDSVRFEEITPRWLEDFDRWCTHAQNTKCIHYRYMRAVFNDAIDEGVTTAYPFRKFKIKSEETKDRSLTLEELRELFAWPVEEYQRKYIDIFKLIFLLRGINMIDLCNLTAQNVQKGRIIYGRAKTGKPYSIKIEPEIQELLDKYKGEKYLVNILELCADHTTYISRINKELKKIGTVTFGKRGKKTIIPRFPELSTYWARHTYAMIGKHECELSIDDISDLLGHSHGMAVTNVYVRKNDDKIDQAARKIIDKVLYDK